MELASPGPLSEKIILNGKASSENGIIQEHLKFDCGDTLNSDRLQDSEIGDSSNDEKRLTQEYTKCLHKEQDYKQISLNPDPNDKSANTNLNENSSESNGSLIESEKSKTPSENHESENENENEKIFMDAKSFKPSSEISDDETSNSNPRNSLGKSSIGHGLGK